MSAIVHLPKGQLQQAYGDVAEALPTHRAWAQNRVEWAMQQMAQGTAHLVIQDLREQQGAIARHFESRLSQMNLSAQRQQELYSAIAATQSAIAQSVGTLTTAIQQQTAAIQSHQQVMQAHGMAIVDQSQRLHDLGLKIDKLTAATENAAIVQQSQADLRYLPPSTGRVDHHHHHSDSMGYVGPVIAAAMAATIVGAAVWGPANVQPQQTQIRVNLGQ